jgi:hypothetical protein
MNQMVSQGVRATAFTEDRVYVASCQSVGLWAIDGDTPRFVSSVDDGTCALFLRVVDKDHLLVVAYESDSSGATRLLLRILEFRQPADPKIVHQFSLEEPELRGYVNPSEIRVFGDKLALPIASREDDSGRVLLLQFAVRTGFNLLASITHPSRYSDRAVLPSLVTVTADRIISISSELLQIRSLDKPAEVQFSLSR